MALEKEYQMTDPVQKEPQDKTATVMNEVREIIDATYGTFSIYDVYQFLGNLPKTQKGKRNISQCLSRLVNEGIIERNGSKNGLFRRIENELESIDFLSADSKCVDIWLPLGLTQASDEAHNTGLIELMDSEVVIIAGDKGSGKTTICLNIAKENMDRWDTHYFDSESGPSALKRNLSNFDIDLIKWTKVTFSSRYDHYEDVIQPGSGSLNIIDFLEPPGGDEYYKLAGLVSAIHRKLKGAIAIIAVQKKTGARFPRGGEGVFEKARLSLLVSRGTLKIANAKNWATAKDPTNKAMNFRIVKKAQLVAKSEWR